MDGNIYQNSSNTGYPLYAPGLSNDESSGIMPPLAPPFKHSPWRAESGDYHSYDSEQQALNRLMDSVHQGRIEDVRIGQDIAQIRLEDAQVVGGGIEIRARITPKPSPNQFHPQYQYPNQLPPQYSYPYQYLNQLPIQYPYQYQCPSRTPTRYLYQYPVANAAGGIASAISQLVWTANLLRR